MIESELEKAVDRAPDSCQYLGGYTEAAEEEEQANQVQLGEIEYEF
jgi:hypothetical protein